MGVHITNSSGHTEAWESISPTRGATLKCGSPYPQLEGPHRSVGVHIPNSRGHTEVWESISPTRGATQLCGFMNPYSQLKGPQKNCGFEVRGQNPAFEVGIPKKNPNSTTEPPSSYQKKPKNVIKKNPNLTKNPSCSTKKKTLPQTPKPYRAFFWFKKLVQMRVFFC